MADLPGIGSKSEQALQRIQEQYPLPDTRKDVIKAVEGILGRGGVQKLVIQLGQPIRIERLVRAGEALIPEQEVLDGDLFFASRNADIIPFEAAEGSERVLLFAFREIRKRKATPRAFIVNHRDFLAKYLALKTSAELDELYGVQVIEHRDVPEDVLLFVATKAEDPESLAFTLKILLEE